MFKHAHEYSCEELLQSSQEFFGGAFWAWYGAVVKVIGEEKTEEILIQLAEDFAGAEEAYLNMLWGKEFTNLREVAAPLDVVHRMVGYDFQWTMENDFKGYEKITRCPIFSTTPEEYKGMGPTALCTVYCKTIGQKFYGRMKSTIEQDARLSDGDAYCGFKIERRRTEV